MKIGIFGTADEPIESALAKEIKSLGFDPLHIRADALDEGLPLSIIDNEYWYLGKNTNDIKGFYLRGIPGAYAPYMEKDDSLVLFDDWYTQYIHAREKASYFVSWLIALQHQKATLVNPPQAASVLQYKPFQLHVLKAVGAEIPRTLISNDPKAIKQFKRENKDVIFKPITGGAITRRLDASAMKNLDAVTYSPVIFQECIDGDDLRVMLVGDEIVSCVAVKTPQQHLDFRDDPSYSGGEAWYEEVTLPPVIIELCRKAARECGLLFAGIDIKKTKDGRWVFLELNSSPIYIDVEFKLGHQITKAIAELTVGKRKVKTKTL
jgi:glutathione synthase/RimK-type ligase-like ATP-grasp enzyme